MIIIKNKSPTIYENQFVKKAIITKTKVSQANKSNKFNENEKVE